MPDFVVVRELGLGVAGRIEVAFVDVIAGDNDLLVDDLRAYLAHRAAGEKAGAHLHCTPVRLPDLTETHMRYRLGFGGAVDGDDIVAPEFLRETTQETGNTGPPPVIAVFS